MEAPMFENLRTSNIEVYSDVTIHFLKSTLIGI